MSDVKYQYKPREGAFIIGVPQRDLTDLDAQRAGPHAMRDAVASGLYEPVKPAKAEPKDAKTDEVKP